MKRRKFIRNTFLGTAASFIGVEIVFSSSMPKNYTPIVLQNPDPYKLFNKDKDMTVLNDKPWNVEAKAHLLDDKVTPNRYMFIRKNGIIPQNIDVANWELTIDGESVSTPKRSGLVLD